MRATYTTIQSAMDRKQVTTEDDNMLDEVDPPVPVSSASSLDSYLVGLPNFDVLGELGTFSSNPTNTMDTPVILSGGSAANSVPEFLYQLTKMLTDDNREVIEWSNGVIEVHNPRRLETEVLNKYFRHSKFASFQRQLNYFGFRKLAGKGKMAPCSYVNEAVTGDLGSLLLIKRKTNTTPREKGSKGTKKKETTSKKSPQLQPKSIPTTAKPRVSVVGNTNNQTTGITAKLTANSSQEDIARSAVGKGIRYSFEARERAMSLSAAGPATAAVDASHSMTGAPRSLSTTVSYPEASLNELENNFRNSLKEARAESTSSSAQPDSDVDPTPLSQMRHNNVSPFNSGVLTGFLSRNSSLIDLAMIPDVEDTAQPARQTDAIEYDPALSFVDFPHPEVDPSSSTNQPSDAKVKQEDSAE